MISREINIILNLSHLIDSLSLRKTCEWADEWIE